jgi:hypothetical protein
VYAKTWEEFDTSGGNCPTIAIANLAPFIERLNDNGHPCGFSVSQDWSRYKAVWSRVMTNPEFFPQGRTGLKLSEALQEKYGFEFLNRLLLIARATYIIHK